MAAIPLPLPRPLTDDVTKIIEQFIRRLIPRLEEHVRYALIDNGLWKDGAPLDGRLERLEEGVAIVVRFVFRHLAEKLARYNTPNAFDQYLKFRSKSLIRKHIKYPLYGTKRCKRKELTEWSEPDWDNKIRTRQQQQQAENPATTRAMFPARHVRRDPRYRAACEALAAVAQEVAGDLSAIARDVMDGVDLQDAIRAESQRRRAEAARRLATGLPSLKCVDVRSIRREWGRDGELPTGLAERVRQVAPKWAMDLWDSTHGGWRGLPLTLAEDLSVEEKRHAG
jgi:hypothetical protein